MALPKLALVADKLPLISVVPATLIPVPVTVTILALPPTDSVIFPFITGIFTLLVPLLIPVPVGIAAHVSVPEPFVCK